MSTTTEEVKSTSAGLDVLMRLQSEGLFSFNKNVPDKKKSVPTAVSAKIPKKTTAYISPDAAYGNFEQLTSFADTPSSPDHPKNQRVDSTISSENCIASKTTKGSSLMSSGAMLASPTSPKPFNNKNNLDVIEEENLVVEEGCENELELSRVTIQKIRQGNRVSH